MHILKFCCFLISFLYACSACGQKNDAPDFEILVYGLHRNNTHENAKQIVAFRWGISFKSVANCLISEPLKDSADIANKRTDSLISMKYGKNWHQKFEKEIETEEKLLEKLIHRIEIMDCISRLDSTLAKENNGVYYLIYPYSNLRSEKRYEVFVYGWGTIDKRTDLVCYYKFKFHKNRKNIELITDKPTFLSN
ncbi:hypothetical protein [Fluviicola sp.]|uniref:hypothetical protein n=1 Tax=Fluviicola sp. TaxID=1917219 RepID=UPI00261CB7F8|nr:hypothetical protein [Fluviicola sp.]